MANLLITFRGSGTWQQSYTPTDSDFITELKRKGWHPLNFFLIGVSNRYEFTLTINEPTTARMNSVAAMETELRNYFSVYFNNLSFKVYSSSTGGIPTQTQTNPQSNNPVLNAQLEGLINSAQNASNPNELKKAETLNDFATKLGVSVGVLGIVGLALVLVLTKK